MRIIELFEARQRPTISDQERGKLVQFITQWLQGKYMSGGSENPVAMWEKISSLYPSRVSRPLTLMRLVTVPIEYADIKTFRLEHPAPRGVGSWRSTYFGLSSVHGIATESGVDSGQQKWGDTCRIAIRAKIAPADILATYNSLKRAYISLTFDYDYDSHGEEGGVDYLGITNGNVLEDIGYYQSLFLDFHGGPMRQYEHIVRTTPLEVTNVAVFRKGHDEVKIGHDDPHNSGSYRGYNIS